MLENVCAHQSPGSGKGIATSPAEREPKRNQAVSPYGRFTLVTLRSLGSIAPVWSCASHFRFTPESGPAADITACLKRASTASRLTPCPIEALLEMV
jgi:hypothetical protein